MKCKKRIISLLLAGTMLFSAAPLSVLAEETQQKEGLCEHHRQHTEECGYSEGTPGVPCTHRHTEECYRTENNCTHQHTQECYPNSSESETPDDGNSSENLPTDGQEGAGEPAAPILLSETFAEATNCTHICSEESGCVTKVLDCKHTHDESCGYVEEVPAQPCGFVCDICGKTEQQEAPEQGVKIVSEWAWKMKEKPQIETADTVEEETEKNLPVYQNERWELTLPLTSPENPMSKEQVIDLLPKEIILTLEPMTEQPPEENNGESNEDNPEQNPSDPPKEEENNGESNEDNPEQNPSDPPKEEEDNGEGNENGSESSLNAESGNISLLDDKKANPSDSLSDNLPGNLPNNPQDDEDSADPNNSPDGEAPNGEPENGITPNASPDNNPQKPKQETVALTWEVEDYPEEGAHSGEFVATASLPQEYQLKEGVAPLQIFLSFRAGGVSLETLREHEVENDFVPLGTRINLFDYWTEEKRKEPDFYDNFDNPEQENKSRGINEGHYFKFGPGGSGRVGSYNGWTHSEDPHSQFINDVLESGYPYVPEKPTHKDENKAKKYYGENDNVGSLDYLFDPMKEHGGKESFSEVQNLLQIDADGYYYYDSTKNYARFNEDTKTFVLYDTPAIKRNDNQGQFFPFQSEGQVATYYKGKDGKLEPDWNKDSASKDFNHYFGLTMETRFVQKNNGFTYRGKPITYEFSGDDDVWVFIDDVLVADLGGIHNKASFTIDFSTGKITINGKSKTTIKAQFEKAGVKGQFKGDTFANNTYHTLKFFYLERGNYESNMSLRYNLIPIPESELVKVNQMGESLPGVTFTMYAAKEDYSYEDAIFTGTTDESGYLHLRDDIGAPMTFEQLSQKYDTQYFVLKEETPLDGYRNAREIRLHYNEYQVYDETKGVIESENPWESGTYAQMKVTTTAPNEIKFDEGSFDLVNGPTSKDMRMFAVIFQKGEDNQWYPISGDPLTGWHVQEDNKWENVIAAVRENPYLFELETGGAFQVSIDNMPGKPEEYYSFLLGENPDNNEALEKARYYVAYYCYKVSADNDVHLIENEEEFQREFSTRLYVPNIKNNLLVHKTDERGQALNGAIFGLYQETDVTVKEDGTYQISDEAKPFDEETTSELTNMDGGIIFPTNGKTLNKGTYYLIETEAPKGYEKNPTAIKVIVDDSGVYADAGDEKDNVWVARSVGSVVRSMLQFASDDDVNATLHDIKAQLLTADSYNGEGTQWTDWQQNPQPKSELHLQYEENDPALDYGLTDAEKDEHDYPALVTASGWSKLEIRQCLVHDPSSQNRKENLRDTNLTNLFSGLTTVIVANDIVGGSGNLEVSKEVKGEKGELDREFHFTVTLSDKTVNGKYGEMEFADGVATFTLKHGESKTATGIPAGVIYTVTEQEANRDGYTTSDTGASGTIPNKGTAVAAFINQRGTVPDKPDKPEEPDKPGNPEYPNIPEEPKEPNQPEPAEEPSDPKGEEEEQSPVKPPKKTPNTGDERAVKLWAALGGISLTGLIAACFGKKKR